MYVKNAMSCVACNIIKMNEFIIFKTIIKFTSILSNSSFCQSYSTRWVVFANKCFVGGDKNLLRLSH